ncbi:MAG TPA: c-type cytochrome [Gaiellaceae bacterium]|nr:c-type cytochrome [Gaiellaceae bacterium]
MLSTIFFVVAGLSTGHKIGLAVIGAAFIVFALGSAFLVPRFNANFPGRGLGWYIVLCVAFFIAMISAVVVFGREKPEAKAASETTTSTATTSPSPQPGPNQGDPVAGKAVFTSAGCISCHTLKAANSHGTVGPNLDQLKPPYARIVTQVENGGAIMPPFKDKLTSKQIHDVAAFVYTSTH